MHAVRGRDVQGRTGFWADETVDQEAMARLEALDRPFDGGGEVVPVGGGRLQIAGNLEPSPQRRDPRTMIG